LPNRRRRPIPWLSGHAIDEGVDLALSAINRAFPVLVICPAGLRRG
jgi:hypothetical protein